MVNIERGNQDNTVFSIIKISNVYEEKKKIRRRLNAKRYYSSD